MNLSAAAWTIAIALVLAAAGLSRARRRREQAAWQKWMRDTDMALDAANAPVSDFTEWEAQIGGGR